MISVTLKKMVSLGLVLGLAALVLTGCEDFDSGTFLGMKSVKDLVLPELTVEKLVPADQESGVNPGTVLAVYFSEPIKADSITDDAISINYINPDLDPGQAKIHYEWALAADGKKLEIKPIGDLLAGETVSVVWGCQFTSEDGQVLVPINESLLSGVCATSQFQVAP